MFIGMANNLTGQTSRPFQGSSLYLDLMSETLDPRITFTRASTTTRFNSQGVMEVVPANVWLPDYDPVTLKCLGRGVWESRTNLLTYSEDFSNAAWSKQAVTVSWNQTTAPDDTQNADKIIDASSASTAHYTSPPSLSAVTGTSYTYSVFAKAAELRYLQLIITGIGTGGANTLSCFDLVSGVCSTALSGGTASIQNCGNGWYRCSLSVTSTATVASLCQIRTCATYNTAGAESHVGDGVSGLYVWGAQLEAGSFVTPYIPTTTAAVTRAFEIPKITTLSPWLNASEGTLYAEANSFDTLSTAIPCVVSLDDNTANNRFQLRKINATMIGSMISMVGGVAQANTGSGANTWLSGINYAKIAGYYKQDDFNGAVNSTMFTRDTLGTVPTVTQMQLGIGAGLGSLNGYLKKLAYYPVAMPTQIQGLTQ